MPCACDHRTAESEESAAGVNGNANVQGWAYSNGGSTKVQCVSNCTGIQAFRNKPRGSCKWEEAGRE